jgi:quercetin dioxygenase-like cupin family protein
MHRSETVDYGIVLEGEMVLMLDDGVEVELRPGDIVIQRGTDHAWANRSGAVARMAFVLVDGAFADGLRALLPGGGIESGMEGSTAGLQTD